MTYQAVPGATEGDATEPYHLEDASEGAHFNDGVTDWTRDAARAVIASPHGMSPEAVVSAIRELLDSPTQEAIAATRKKLPDLLEMPAFKDALAKRLQLASQHDASHGWAGARRQPTEHLYDVHCLTEVLAFLRPMIDQETAERLEWFYEHDRDRPKTMKEILAVCMPFVKMRAGTLRATAAANRLLNAEHCLKGIEEDPIKTLSSHDTVGRLNRYQQELRDLEMFQAFSDAYPAGDKRFEEMTLGEMPPKFKELPSKMCWYVLRRMGAAIDPELLEHFISRGKIKVEVTSTTDTPAALIDTRKETAVIVLPTSGRVCELLEMIGEEAGHALRWMMASVPNSRDPFDVNAHEFFGFIGRKMAAGMADDMPSLTGFYPKKWREELEDPEEVRSANVMPAPGMPSLSEMKESWEKAHRLLRQGREMDAHAVIDLLPTSGEQREAYLYQDVMDHEEGYVSAAQVPRAVLRQIDATKLFALPDSQVRKRFFRPEPDTSGLTLDA